MLNKLFGKKKKQDDGIGGAEEKNQESSESQPELHAPTVSFYI